MSHRRPFVPRGTLPLGGSDIAAWARCRQLYWHRQAAGAVERYEPALAIGRAMHAAVEVLHTSSPASNPMRLAAACTSAVALLLDCADDRRDQTVALVGLMIAAYEQRWRAEPLTASSTEIEISASLRHPETGRRCRTHHLRGRLDGIAATDAGIIGDWVNFPLYLYELKTTSDTLDDVEAYLRESPQTHLYQTLAASAGYVLHGTLIDIVKKPVSRPRKGESLDAWGQRVREQYAAEPDRFFRRKVLPRDEAKEREALALAWRTAAEMAAERRNGIGSVPVVKGLGCKTHTGWCPFRGPCWYGSADDTFNTFASDDAREDSAA